MRGRWLPPWHVLAGAALLLLSLLHYLAGPTDTPGLEYLKYISLGAVALCLPRIALRAAMALRNWVSRPGPVPPSGSRQQGLLVPRCLSLHGGLLPDCLCTCGALLRAQRLCVNLAVGSCTSPPAHAHSEGDWMCTCWYTLAAAGALCLAYL